ncbi:MAG: hypothetical protein WCQ69_08585 [Bacteroidales bacterium]|nr:hypothetical protein [Bacteroidales bacterium]MDD2264977.1 hypothetical protein [Bacteroidales bacterium]MDD2832145.1 hypothetical protein [Bacteroidales bacterium]MDD3208797.1 hypothetical protein [Bacteroidales bacterium]MDD3697360.1 hypothetical protein [Bacteroidales bacterium]
MKRRLPFSIGLLSSGMVAFQLVLMQILSISQWNHFAYMIISVAMLGFGASGTILSFLKKYLTGMKEKSLPGLMLLTSVSIMGILFMAGPVFGGFDAYLVFYEKKNLWNLAFSYFILFIPFLTGATAIGLSYIIYAKEIGKLYFADLTGSAAGGLLMLFLFWHFSPSTLPCVIACLPLAAGLLLWSGKAKVPIAAMGIMAVILIITGFFNPPVLPVSQYKNLSRTLLLPGALVEEKTDSPYGELKRVRAPGLRYAPGLSLTYSGTVPVREVLFNNGNWFGPLVPFDTTATEHFLDYSTYALPFVLDKPGTVLVVDAGSGLLASHALTHGAGKIIAIEPNRAAVEMLYRNMTVPGKQLRFIPALSRNYLLTGDQYDLILLPEIGSFGGNSGIRALEEQYLFTRESFSQMWKKLSSRGMIAATVWMDHPPRNSLKMLATMVQAAASGDVTDPRDHIAAVRSWSTITFILKKSSITKEDIRKIREFCFFCQFDPLLYPGITREERENFNILQDDSFFSAIDCILGPEQETLYREYDFQIRPATDAKPFFSQFLRLDRMSKMKEVFGASSVPFLEVGYLILLVTLAQITLAAFLFIILPLVFKKVPGRKRTFPLVFFAAIGTGYMFTEIILIRQFTLYLGHPLYAASAVLSGMLFFSGAGAALSGRLITNRKRFATLAVCIVLMLAILAPGLPFLLRTGTSVSLIIKLILCMVVIAPLAFLMGMMFPSGIRSLALHHEGGLIPWAWAINGSFSVISTALATVIAVEAGYPAVMWIAAATYLIAGICTRSRHFSIFVT